jgi:hypothetical protein
MPCLFPTCALLALLLGAGVTGAVAETTDAAIATPDSDIRPTFSADGELRLWGTIDAQGRHEILEQRWRDGRWESPRRSGLNSGPAEGAGKDFDPVLVPDGSGVLFFSDRAGGAGGTDLWFAPRDAQGWGEARAVRELNSGADEWSPSLSPDGRWLLFSSDRQRPGRGHRLYLAQRRGDGTWHSPRPVAGTGVERYAFDPCWLGRGGWIAYSRSPDPGRGSELMFARLGADARLRAVRRLPAPFNNASGWAFGCAWNPREPDHLYLSTALGDRPQRLDIYRLPLPPLRH